MTLICLKSLELFWRCCYVAQCQARWILSKWHRKFKWPCIRKFEKHPSVQAIKFSLKNQKKMFGFVWNCLKSGCLTTLRGFEWFFESVARRLRPVTLLKKETLAQVFSCEFCETSKNTFYYRTPLFASSGENAWLLKNYRPVRVLPVVFKI